MAEINKIKSIGSHEYVVDKEYSALEHTKNDRYDLDIAFLIDSIKVIIRSSEPRSSIINKLQKIADFPGFQ